MKVGVPGMLRSTAWMTRFLLAGASVRLYYGHSYFHAPTRPSSANLNKSYFTNRQDRYLHFASTPALANYCFDFLRLFVPFSYRLESNAPFKLHWPNATVEPTETEDAAEHAITKFQASHRAVHDATDASDTLVFPLVQAGHFNIREEERCISRVFSELGRIPDPARGVVDLTSGYFALHAPYQELLINSPVSSRIIAAGPKVSV